LSLVKIIFYQYRLKLYKMTLVMIICISLLVKDFFNVDFVMSTPKNNHS